MGDVVAFALTILALALLLFAIGAISGWSWAVKSLEVSPPRWIAAVLLAAGLAFVAAAIVNQNWLLAGTSALFYGIIVAGALRIGPFRRAARSE